MEVMIATIIISIMSITLLQVRANNSHLSDYFLNKNQANDLISIVSQNFDKTYHNKQLHLDYKIGIRFKIDDNLRTHLKKFDLLYIDKVISTKDLLEEKSDDIDDDYENEEDVEESDEKMLYEVKIRKVSISDKKLTNFFYTLEFE